MIRAAAALTFALVSNAAAQDGPVPDCADAGGMQDCALLAGPLILVFLHQPVSDGAVLTVTQSTAEGGDREVSGAIPIKGTVSPPVLYDLDGDGVAEVFVPVAYAEPQTTFQLWRLGGAGFYAQTDTLNAIVPQAFLPVGDLILHVGPEEDGRTVESTYLLEDGALTLVYAVQMDTSSETCTMLSGSGVWNEAIILADCEARLGEVELEENL